MSHPDDRGAGVFTARSGWTDFLAVLHNGDRSAHVGCSVFIPGMDDEGDSDFMCEEDADLDDEDVKGVHLRAFVLDGPKIGEWVLISLEHIDEVNRPPLTPLLASMLVIAVNEDAAYERAFAWGV